MDDLNEKIAQYFTRIGLSYDPLVKRDNSLLNRIQYAHVTHVPYENCDILQQIPLSLTCDALYEKIVVRHRGGYCFELNGLYSWLLQALGFPVVNYMARFLRGETEIPMRRHRVLKVEVEGNASLCDVGIGQIAPRFPLLLKEGLIQEQFGEIYKMEKEPFLGWVLYEIYHNEWRKVFSFTEEEQLEIDYVMPSFYCENATDSIFRKAAMLSIKTEDGRITLDHHTFKIFQANTLVLQKEVQEQELPEILHQYFGL